MPARIVALVLSFLSFFAFWNPNAQPNNIPETRSFVGEASDKYGVWPTEAFETGGIFPLLPPFLEARYFLKDMRSSTTDSLLILHKGKIVYERYAEGWDADTPHWMASVTKAVLSALVGIAIGEGKIGGVGDKVVDYFPEAVTLPGWQAGKADMTIEHLLTMTSGLPGDGDRVDWDWWDAEDSGLAAFLAPQMAAPGTRYSYSSGPSCQTLACLVSRAVKKNLFEYAKEKLFGPLGMASVEWDAAEDGRNFGGFGISMTPRDMARFGYLYLNQGRWEDSVSSDTRQVIPADYVAVTPPKSKASKAYGYLFWNFPMLPFDSSFEANGAWGQYIDILPEWDAVIVRTASQNWLDGKWDELQWKLDELGLKFW